MNHFINVPYLTHPALSTHAINPPYPALLLLSLGQPVYMGPGGAMPGMVGPDGRRMVYSPAMGPQVSEGGTE